MKLDEENTKERHIKYSKELSEGLMNFRELAANFNWASLPEQEKVFKTEEISAQVQSAIWNKLNFYFQMGFIAGVKMGQEISNII